MIKLIKGDCLVEMQNIPDKSIDCIICDLPYGTTACKWDTIIPFEPLWAQYKRIIKDNGAIVLFGAEPFSSSLRISNLKWYKYDWVWKKTRPTGHLQAKKQPLKNTEYISVFYKKQCTYNPQGLKEVNIINHNTEKRLNSSGMGKVIAGEYYTQTNTNYPRRILEFDSEHNVGGYMHPNKKPLDLIEYLIKTYTNEGDTVLDNTMGSGTTGVACKQINRSFIGIEMDDKYFEIAKSRIESHVVQSSF